MADIEFIIPGCGIVNDTQEDAEVIIPGFGIYNQQVAAVVGWTGTVLGVTNPAKIMGIDVANIAKVIGIP